MKRINNRVLFLTFITLLISFLGCQPTATKEVENKNTKAAAPIIENRFIAIGKIIDVKLEPQNVQKFRIKLKEAKQYQDYPNLGNDYLEKEVEIFSEIGIPSSFKAGADVSAIIRVSGDECGQRLFLVKEFKNEAGK